MEHSVSNFEILIFFCHYIKLFCSMRNFFFFFSDNIYYLYWNMNRISQNITVSWQKMSWKCLQLQFFFKNKFYTIQIFVLMFDLFAQQQSFVHFRYILKYFQVKIKVASMQTATIITWPTAKLYVNVLAAINALPNDFYWKL